MQTSLTRDGFAGTDTPAINRDESGSNERNREARKVERSRAISISDYAPGLKLVYVRTGR